MKYKIIEGPSYTPRIKFTPGHDIYLKGLALPLMREEGEVTPGLTNKLQNKGYLWSISEMICSHKGIDSSMIKHRKGKHPHIVLFGDMAAKAHPIEKKLVDMIIHQVRAMHLHAKDDITDFVLSHEEIVKNKGLDLSIENQVLSPNEILYVKSYMELQQIPRKCPAMWLEKYNLKDLIRITDEIEKRQYLIRDVKRLLEEVTSARVSALFEYHKSKRTKNYQKIKIKTLIEMSENTPPYGAFNPTKLLALQRLPILPSFKVCPNNPYEIYAQTLERGEVMLKDFKNSSEISSLYSEYTGLYIGKLDY
jgi:hypothetical protein